MGPIQEPCQILPHFGPLLGPFWDPFWDLFDVGLDWRATSIHVPTDTSPSTACRNIFLCVLFVDGRYVSGGTFNSSTPAQFRTPFYIIFIVIFIFLRVRGQVWRAIQTRLVGPSSVTDHQDGLGTDLGPS